MELEGVREEPTTNHPALALLTDLEIQLANNTAEVTRNTTRVRA